jgi:hypothetical protein
MKKTLTTLFFLAIALMGFAQSDEAAIRKVIEAEDIAFHTNVDRPVYMSYWLIKPETRWAYSSLDGLMVYRTGEELKKGMANNEYPPADNATCFFSNVVISTNNSMAWVSYDLKTVTPQGITDYTHEFRFMEKIKSVWKIISATVHQYKPKEQDTEDKDTEDKEALIRRLEDREREAFLKNDTTNLLTQLWSPDMVINAPSNTVNTLNNLIKRIASGKQNYARFERKIDKITFNDNLAIVMGEEQLEPQGASDNAGKKLTRRFTNIWKYANGNWRMIARQSTIIKVE